MYNNHPKFRETSLKHRLCTYGIILLTLLSITMAVLGLAGIISKTIVAPVDCLSSLLCCCILAKILRRQSKKLFYVLVGCSGVCFICFIIVVAVTYFN